MSKKTKALVSSAVAIALCANVVAGATYALFTSQDSVNIAVTSGTVAVKAGVSDFQYKTLTQDWTAATQNGEVYESTFDGIGGKATLDGKTITLDKVVPGDAVKFKVNITNESTVNVKYRVIVAKANDTGLFGGLDVMVDGEEFAGEEVGDWTELAPTDAVVQTIPVVIELPQEAGNDFQGKATDINVMVEAVQGNAPMADVWDGTSDSSWFNKVEDEANNVTSYTLNKASQIAGLADLVDAGETFEGKTIQLAGDVDFEAYDANGERISFDPIGYGYNTVFKGTFDGQGHTIANLYQNGWALGLDYSTEGGGMFASVVDATFKDIVIENSEIVMECIDMGTLVGYSYGNCTYENIEVKGGTVANYNRYTGGLVGEVNGTQTFKNIKIDKDTVVSALWGTYDAGVGGIIGGKWGAATLTFENCVVEAQLDVFNDACSNYQYYNYRLSGMLIGCSEEATNGVATASYLTCTNVTVIYNDWANYTYCEFEANGAGSYNGPGEWKFSRVQAGYAYDGVDPNHTHGADESHEELLVFDQLFGGDKGVRGGKTHPGVTVIYNN